MVVYAATIRMRDDLQAIDQTSSFNINLNESAGVGQAWEDANEIAEAMAGTILPDNIHIYQIGVREVIVSSAFERQTRAVSIDGVRTTTGSTLPSWNTVKMQASAALGSRLSTFHLRMGLTEDDVTGQNLVSGVLTALNSFKSALILQGTPCTPLGELFTAYTFDELVRNRQQGWHRRTRVGFKRGWVPV